MSLENWQMNSERLPLIRRDDNRPMLAELSWRRSRPVQFAMTTIPPVQATLRPAGGSPVLALLAH